MKMFKRILVVSWLTPDSRTAIKYGVSLARKYESTIHVLHLVTNPVELKALNAPGLFPEEEYRNYADGLQESREQLAKVVRQEVKDGLPLHELISDRDPMEEILKVVEAEKIDLIVMLAHEEGRIEHALFGGKEAEIIRRMPCSILLVKKEPESVIW